MTTALLEAITLPTASNYITDVPEKAEALLSSIKTNSGRIKKLILGRENKKKLLADFSAFRGLCLGREQVNDLVSLLEQHKSAKAREISSAYKKFGDELDAYIKKAEEEMATSGMDKYCAKKKFDEKLDLTAAEDIMPWDMRCLLHDSLENFADANPDVRKQKMFRELARVVNKNYKGSDINRFYKQEFDKACKQWRDKDMFVSNPYEYIGVHGRCLKNMEAYLHKEMEEIRPMVDELKKDFDELKDELGITKISKKSEIKK